MNDRKERDEERKNLTTIESNCELDISSAAQEQEEVMNSVITLLSSCFIRENCLSNRKKRPSFIKKKSHFSKEGRFDFRPYTVA